MFGRGVNGFFSRMIRQFLIYMTVYDSVYRHGFFCQMHDVSFVPCQIHGNVRVFLIGYRGQKVQHRTIALTRTSTNRMHSILNRSFKFCFWHLQALLLVVLELYLHLIALSIVNYCLYKALLQVFAKSPNNNNKNKHNNNNF